MVSGASYSMLAPHIGIVEGTILLPGLNPASQSFASGVANRVVGVCIDEQREIGIEPGGIVGAIHVPMQHVGCHLLVVAFIPR